MIRRFLLDLARVSAGVFVVYVVFVIVLSL